MIEGMTDIELGNLMIEISDEYGLPYTRHVKHFIDMLREAVEKSEEIA